MRLRFGHLLVAGLFLCCSALTPEECQRSVTPLSLADPQMMLGRWNFLVGYTDHEVFNEILKITDSSWLTISASPFSTTELVMSEENKIGGKCFGAMVNVTIDGNTAITSLANVTSVSRLLPSCDGCLVFSINSTARNIEKFLNFMNVSCAVTEDSFTVQSLYLMGRESAVKDSDLEHFKQQASCLGFSREPDFLYDPEKGFCVSGEGPRMVA
ncbi:uncharacterized protein LOC121191591 [Toxotes jaculatrix]|uniref:uncharacterized protein LOC121191591 n=1 Tax=Toxotes jaculatrix TaxID=941984 RepID=UPI001B3B0053|nr:uncharacterized protein LOC121191591 [Toxotes jaculatrix]